MRILYVYNLNQVAEVYKQDLIQNGHASLVYEPSLVGSTASFLIKFILMPIRIISLGYIAGNLNSNYYDLVHIHWASFGILGLISRIPYIVECHGSDVRYRLNHPFFRAILKQVFRRAAAVICITPDLLATVKDIRPDVIFFPGSVDTDQFAPEEEFHSSRTHPWTVLLFTRLDPIKGTDITTQGIAQFAQRHPEVRVLLLDWGRLKGKYKEYYGNRFEFISPVPSKEVQNLIRSADVIVGQSNLGILSFCELQAMSCAKPVIASFHYWEAYPTQPPLCQATTPQEVQDHLEILFQHPEVANEIGQKARQWVTTYHNRKILAIKREMLYTSIMSKHKDKNDFC